MRRYQQGACNILQLRWCIFLANSIYRDHEQSSTLPFPPMRGRGIANPPTCTTPAGGVQGGMNFHGHLIGFIIIVHKSLPRRSCSQKQHWKGSNKRKRPEHCTFIPLPVENVSDTGLMSNVMCSHRCRVEELVLQGHTPHRTACHFGRTVPAPHVA